MQRGKRRFLSVLVCAVATLTLNGVTLARPAQAKSVQAEIPVVLRLVGVDGEMATLVFAAAQVGAGGDADAVDSDGR